MLRFLFDSKLYYKIHEKFVIGGEVRLFSVGKFILDENSHFAAHILLQN